MAGVFWTDYAAAFAEAGAKVGVVFPDLVSVRFLAGGSNIPWAPRITHETMRGANVTRVRGVHTAFRVPGVQMHRFRRWLRRGLDAYRARHGEPDLFHALCAIPSGWACTHFDDSRPRAAVPRRRRPVVVTEQTGGFDRLMPWRRGGPYIRAGLTRADAVVTVSERNRSTMRRADITRDIEVCGNPVASAFTSLDPNEGRGVDPVRALFVGRLVPAKGIRELVAAATALAGQTRLEWHIVGDGPCRAELEAATATTPRLADSLRLHGQLDRAGLVDLMRRSHFLVHPSHGETFGMAVAEALCAGLPVLTTHGTACADFIDDDNGILFPARDPDTLMKGVRRMIESLETFDRTVIAERARQRFSSLGVARWYADLFHRLLSSRAEKD